MLEHLKRVFDFRSFKKPSPFAVGAIFAVAFVFAFFLKFGANGSADDLDRFFEGFMRNFLKVIIHILGVFVVAFSGIGTYFFWFMAKSNVKDYVKVRSSTSQIRLKAKKSYLYLSILDAFITVVLGQFCLFVIYRMIVGGVPFLR